jgi:parvulin-like peptidyl-prolyl isomerase
MKSILREPLVHFLLLGGLLFLFFQWRGSSGPTSSRIVITPGLVEHLASGFGRTWQRPPTDAELKGLIDDYVKEEIATREAVAMGLDRDDTIIRRRLRQKLEFLVEDAASSAPPTDAELEAWLDKHPQSFRAEPQLAFRQVYLSPERRGDSAGKAAEKLLARLRAKGKDATTDGLGDASMLPSEQPLVPLREVARSFGDDFAQDLMKIEPGQWTGPVESPYGLHLVLVQQRVAGAAPELAEIRPVVEREVLAERRKRDLDTLYERLLAKYTVTIEKPTAKPPLAAAAGAGGTR